MHHIHTTPGLVIHSRSYGEAGKMLYIFTRDFGLITAVAQGIRLEKSKLRYHTQEFSFGMFSLVKGREMWRLTSAAPVLRSGGGKDKDVEIELIPRLALLLRRLLQGEESRPEAFDAIQSCAEFIHGNPGLSDAQSVTLESLTVARILHWLGYIGDDSELNGHMRSFDITVELLDSLKGKREVINRHINKALKESMM